MVKGYQLLLFPPTQDDQVTHGGTAETAEADFTVLSSAVQL